MTVTALLLCLPLLAIADSGNEYWDGICTPCPSQLYHKEHCLQGGELIGERGCGPVNAHCEGRCRKPQSSPAPQPTFYWDGQCKPCPASLYSHCSEGGKLVGERGCGFANLLCEGHCMLPAEAPEPADWIIVGGGASGCSAAAALADAGEEVLLLERGASDLDMKETRSASTWPQVVDSEATETIRWSEGVWGAVAKVLGGGTSVNGGLYIEEEPEFMKELFDSDIDVDEYVASSRYIAKTLATPLQPSQFGNDYVKTLERTGLGLAGTGDPSIRMSDNGSWIAYSTIDTSLPHKPRNGAAKLLHDRAHLKNLRFLTKYQVTKINFDGKRAVSVSVLNGRDEASVIKARKGVILAAGAIYTPQLLQVSGIGDPGHLSSLGVNPVVENPAVGSNFIDRNVLTVGAWSSSHQPLYIGYAMASSERLGLTFESEGWGKVASSFTIASLALSPPDQRTEALRTTLRLLFKLGVDKIMDDMIQFVALQHHTHSRGKVVAVSTDTQKPPKVTANYFSDERDLEAQHKALQHLLAFVETPEMQRYVQSKDFKPLGIALPDFLSCIAKTPSAQTSAVVLPCSPHTDASKARWAEYFRNTVVSSYHYFGTAAHGSVVQGEDFHVKGIENLHVVDASVFPKQTRVNPQGSIMAMGHYVGKHLAKKHARRRMDEINSKDVFV
eukprot:TRINITY_DN22576_c0_g1_i1.p1 TRINITY_DN22576_c0_g1~~TRINITY_DN22576_c0_g1_i1.p1  ORF type:complete len:692 (-),score=116.23 TRINITY_DN22576_c0_g1_i1:245-2257(-)